MFAETIPKVNFVNVVKIIAHSSRILLPLKLNTNNSETVWLFYMKSVYLNYLKSVSKYINIRTLFQSLETTNTL